MIIYFFYRLLTVLAFPLILLYLLRRGLRDRRYWRGLGERFGALPRSLDPTVPGGIWLHAVSVGEAISAVELIRQLRVRFPRQPIYVSVTTVAGREIAGQRLAGLADAIFYAPLDLAWAVRRVLRRLQPQLLIVMETEIWPNLFRETRRFGCGLLVVNGRISDKAFPRYRRWKWFFRPVLAWPDRILAQNEQAAGRYRELGAPPERVRDNGNLKYDFRADSVETPEAVAALIAAARPQFVWLAASTMPPAAEGEPDEDDLFVTAFSELSRRYPGLLAVLVPRRPERFPLAAEKLAAAGIPFVRRSALPGASLPLPGVLLLDTMGELVSLFPLADVVFIGGTFPCRGGHNILEPAFFGKPILIGPHMENFPDIAAEFRAGEAARTVDQPEQLAPAVAELLDDAALRRRLGDRALALATARRGATARAVEAAVAVYGEALPRAVPPPLVLALLGPLALLWRAGLRIDQARKLRRRGRLAAPVISIGNITMGGAGKTPMVGFLAGRLSASGRAPAVLTRGYHREDPSSRQLILPAGAAAPVEATGDEAQILLRDGHAAIGIGADRLAAGRELERRLGPGVFLLDDGFQHWRLERGIDLVLLDALDPFGGGWLFPLGRLREPLQALARASAFVVTRADRPVPWPALEDRLRAVAPQAPVFYSRIVPVAWVRFDGERRYPAAEPPWKEIGAFCGIGNPASFWSTLAGLGIRPEHRWTFGDHHRYLPLDLQRMREQLTSNQVTTLVTTQKDWMNLPAEAGQLLAPVDGYWLEFGIEIDRERELLELVERGIRGAAGG